MATNITRKIKTVKGSIIQQSPKYGVGKDIGGYVYLHSLYEGIIPINVLNDAKSKIGDFGYNCLKFNQESITFFNCEEFDTEPCPTVGEYIKVTSTSVYKGYTKSIWHHKWLWVKDDYKGFDVDDSFEYSCSWVMKDIDARCIGNKEYWNDVNK